MLQTDKLQAGLTSYDLVSYPGYTHPQTHPDRLAVIGSLFGLDPADVGRSRVLELGCGNGSNLVPMACGLPESEFVGTDLAAHPIAHGQQMIRDLGLTNVRLIRGNITEISEHWGKFDYIIAHGLYSWVPAEVQRRLLTICSRSLAPHGISFVSFNALPGCHLRNMLREMMLFHARGYDSADERVNQAFALVKFLAEAQDTQDEYRLWMRAELERIKEHEPGHLFHDELADTSEALYFTQFMERAAQHGLQYVGEADFFEMTDHIFKPSVRETLAKIASNRLLREQYLDFLKCRRFRQTLLCHDSVCLQSNPIPEVIMDFLISSSAAEPKDQPADPHSGTTCLFETPRGARVETDFALGKAALKLLLPVWPQPLAFEELHEQARNCLASSGQNIGSEAETRTQLAGFLLQLYAAGVVEFRTRKPSCSCQIAERPMASSLARWQIQHGHFVTTALHQVVKVEDEVGRHLLSWLDGTRDRNALLDNIWGLVREGKMSPLTDANDEAASLILAQELNTNLTKLARLGLLMGL